MVCRPIGDTSRQKILRYQRTARFRTIQDEPDISSVFPICTRVRLQEYVQRCTERFVQNGAGAATSRVLDFGNLPPPHLGTVLHLRVLINHPAMSASLIGRLGQALSGYPPTPVSMSLTGSRFSSDSAPRPFHHGDSKMRWNNLLGDLAVNVTAGSSGHTNSPHPSSREGHHSTAGWSLISSYRI